MEEREDQKRLLVFTLPAQEDIKSVWLYSLEKWGLKQANEYEQFVYDSVEQLCDFPELGQHIDTIDEARMLLIKLPRAQYGHIAV